MNNILLSPPVAFVVLLVFCALLLLLFSKLEYKRKDAIGGGRKSYACGEDIPDHLAQPDYSQFFPFVFFFTIAHVSTLMVTTVPAETLEIFVLASIYLATGIVSLFILLRR